MKTIKFFSVLSLVLIFASVNSVYSSNGTTSKSKLLIKAATIRYVVNINANNGDVLDLCNTYWVRVTDETGRLVAPAQIFVPGVGKYYFNEVGYIKGIVRVASLVLSDDGRFCPITLVTKSEKIDRFLPGNTYSFDLYLIIHKVVIKEAILVGDDETPIDPLP